MNGKSESGDNAIDFTHHSLFAIHFLVVLFETLGEIFDVLRRPARHVHAEVETHGGENFLDLVERLAAEIRRAQHLGFRLLDQVADIHDVVVLQAVRRTDRQLELVDLLEERRVERQLRRSGRGLFLAGLFEVDEDLKLVLQDAGRIGDRIFRARSSRWSRPS